MVQKELVIDVMETNDGKSMAKIEIHRSSACDGCHRNECGTGCSMGMMFGSSVPLHTLAENKVDAQVGDWVTVETESSTVLKSAAIVFLFPLLCAFLSYFIAVHFIQESFFSVLFFLVGLIISFLIIYFIVEKKRKNKTEICIVRVICAVQDHSSADDKR